MLRPPRASADSADVAQPREDPMTTETALMFYERAVKAEAEVKRLQEYVDQMPYPSDMFQLEEQLAMRERQVGFTEKCSAHGLDYSDSCGACAISRRIARFSASRKERHDG